MTRWLSCAVGLALVVSIAGVAAERPAGVRLVEVRSESTEASQSVLITSTEPASYTTLEPDPLTVLIRLGGVATGDVATELRAAPEDPVESVEVVDGVDDDGNPVAQVRIGLREPTLYEVRSRRETIQVRFARAMAPALIPDSADVPAASATVGSAATALLSVGTTVEPHAISVTLHGNGPMLPGRIHESEHLPPQLIIEFPHMASEASAVTSIEVDPVKQVRVVSEGPELSRVVLDLAHPALYHIEHVGTDDRILRVVFPRDSAIDPVARLGGAPAVGTDTGRPVRAAVGELASALPRMARTSSPSVTSVPRPTPDTGAEVKAVVAPAGLDPAALARIEALAERLVQTDAPGVAPASPSTAVAATPIDIAALRPITQLTGSAAVRVDGGQFLHPDLEDVPRPPVWETRHITRLDGPLAFNAGAAALPTPTPGDVPPPVWETRQITRLDSPVAFIAGTAALPTPSPGDLPPPVWPTIQRLTGPVGLVASGGTSLLTPTLSDLPARQRVWPEIARLDGTMAAVDVTTTALLHPSLLDLPAPPTETVMAVAVPANVEAAPTSGAAELTPRTRPIAAVPPPVVEPATALAPGVPTAVLELATALAPAVPAAVVEPATGVAPAVVAPLAGPAPAVPAAVELAAALASEVPAVAETAMALPTQTGQFVPQGGSRRTSETQTTRPSVRVVAQLAAEQQEYTGEPISMNFQGTDLRAVLRVFADVSGLNLVIDPSVNGEVNVALTQVPWDQAFAIILRANGLDYEVDGTVVRIASVQRLQEEAQGRALLAQREAEAGVLVLETFTLSYARAADLVRLITSTSLSPRGEIFTDPRTNTLIVRDLQERVSTIRDLLTSLDRAEPQVEIEARIVEATHESARALGIQWGVTGRASQDIGNTLPFSFPNRGSLTGRSGATEGQGPSGRDPRALPDENAQTVVNMPVNAASSAIGLTLGAVNGALNLDIALSALETRGEARVLSSPHIVTQNNIEAEIVQGDQIPYQTVANNTVTTQFVDAALVLRVTPQITADRTVIMQVEVTNDFPDFSKQVENGAPAIKTQRATTTIQVDDGATTVIGGHLQEHRTEHQFQYAIPQ